MEILEFFNALPPIGQAMLVIGFIMPFAVLHTFFNPEPPPKIKPTKTWSLKNGGVLELYEVEVPGVKDKQKAYIGRKVC